MCNKKFVNEDTEKELTEERITLISSKDTSGMTGCDMGDQIHFFKCHFTDCENSIIDFLL